MRIRETGIEGLTIIEPKVFRDQRGYFLESYPQAKLEALGIDHKFIQDNQSRSVMGVIRGLHFQQEPNAQTKLVRVTEGVIYDVAVDLREGSLTYGEWYGLELSIENHLQLLVPKGFAHGFSVLSPHATILYKCDAVYHPESESGIRFDDPELHIDWKVSQSSAIISEKDRVLPYLKEM
ncbi:MAG: dTDP-4-dehydrorhamnose 3,5-epimerase [Bacteroidetes bacterium]|nr:dTDP-4-dehydrorhamnose 3,5-epimerase [Bacteroidota bacterium]